MLLICNFRLILCENGIISVVFDNSIKINYNTFNRLAEGWVHFTRPGEISQQLLKNKPSPNLPEYRTAYFLFDRFRIATTSNANVSKIMNSSYVLIKYHTFLQTRERVGARPSASRVNILWRLLENSIILISKKTGNIDFIAFPVYTKQITGIEPASPAWEASILPMNYICTKTIIIPNEWKCKEKYEKNKRLKKWI